MSSGFTAYLAELRLDIVFTPIRLNLSSQYSSVALCQVSLLLADFHISRGTVAVWTANTAVCFLTLSRWAGRKQSFVAFHSEMCIFLQEQAANG